MRYAFIKTLTEVARANDRIFLLTGDLGYTVFEEFRDEFPKRFINVGVAEQNMMSIAAGLALTGKIVFAYTIATFASMRAFEQVRTDIASHKAAVTIVGTGGGFSYSYLSITHHSIEDINLMRGIPEMTVLCPADPIEVVWATKTAIAIERPVYLRLGKKGEPNLYKKTPILKLGKGSILRRGRDTVIIATGNLVHTALVAANLLSQKGIEATVVSMHTIKPIDSQLIKKLAKSYKAIATLEEHSIIGGLGSAVSEVISDLPSHARLVRFGVPDTFVFEIGSQDFLRKKIGLDPENIANKIYQNLKK